MTLNKSFNMFVIICRMTRFTFSFKNFVNWLFVLCKKETIRCFPWISYIRFANHILENITRIKNSKYYFWLANSKTVVDQYSLIQRKDFLQGRRKSRRYIVLVWQCMTCVSENIVFFFYYKWMHFLLWEKQYLKADLKLSAIWDTLDLIVGSQKLLMTMISKYCLKEERKDIIKIVAHYVV